MIGYFKFTVEPWTYATGYFPGSATVLRISAEYNGKRYDIQEIMPAMLPWETELEHYARRAVEVLQRTMQAQEATT